MCCLQETHFSFKDIDGLKTKSWEKNKYHTNSSQNKPGVTVLIPEKIDFNTENICQRQRRIFYKSKRANPIINIY